MPLLQLESPLEVDTPLGRGYAVLVESDACEQWWTVALSNGALVTFTQNRVRAAKSYSHKRGVTDAEMHEMIQ